MLWGRPGKAPRPASQETCQTFTENPSVGCDSKEDKMTTQSAKTTVSATKIVSLAFAAVLGVAIISITGHVQASALHDAAHDVRHATGFPCH